MGFWIFPALGIGLVLIVIWYHVERSRQAQFINQYVFPERIQRKLCEAYPELSPSQSLEVISALRDYFQMCRIAGRRSVAMPSQAVDVVWHEFILFTRYYQEFCQRAFGRFLHHTPAEAMRGPRQAQTGIKTAWRLACRLENIRPRTPTRLPRIFALDHQLKIPNGFHYQLNCAAALAASTQMTSTQAASYCATHIACGSCSSSCSSDGGGHSSGCSAGDGGGSSGCGSSCGGGCGGD